jgi:ribokinase
MADVVVLGRVGRDLVLCTSALPEPGGSATVGERRELLGGRGANQALAQLGVPVALVGVVGDDSAGTEAVAQAAADGIDVSAVVRCRGAATALVVHLVEDGGVRRLLEDVPGAVLLTPDDVAAATDQLAAAQVVSLQLEQPGAAVGAALQRVPEGAVVVVDGAPEDDATRDAVLVRADVVRADATETRLLTGRDLSGVDDARDVAAELLTAGARVIALGVGEAGDLVAWRAGPRFGVAAEELEVDPGWADGDVLVPPLGEQPVGPTGAGDAYVATLVATLLAGAPPEDAAWAASATAGLTVAHAGGRPQLDPGVLGAVVCRGRSR